MTVFFIWEVLLALLMAFYFRRIVKRDAKTNKPAIRGFKALFVAKHPLLTLFRISLSWIPLAWLSIAYFELLVPNEIFLYGMLIGTVMFTFALVPNKEGNSPFSKEMPFVLAVFGFGPWLLSFLFCLNLLAPINTFSKTYTTNTFKSYQNPSETYWVRVEDELYPTTKVLLKIPQAHLTSKNITVRYTYGVCGLVRIDHYEEGGI